MSPECVQLRPAWFAENGGRPDCGLPEDSFIHRPADDCNITPCPHPPSHHEYVAPEDPDA